jgi:hypothetical protein
MAEDMRTGNWTLNGESIKFSEDPRTLLDGQNRLLACIEAETPFTTLVAYDLPHSTQDTMDTATSRIFSDVLNLMGEQHYVALAAIVRAVHLWKLNPGVWQSYTGAPSHRQLLATLEKNPDLRDITKKARHVTREFAINPTIVGLCWWQFTQLDDPDVTEDAEDFFSRLGSDIGHKENDPVYVLRKTIEAQRRTGKADSLNRRWVHAITIKAWNAYREGREIKFLRFRTGGANPEPFPEPK